jgi:hypothetical protein
MMGAMAEKQKDPVAQSLVAKRWAKTSAAERSQVAKDLNEARWGKKKAEPKNRKRAK